ncbi:unnamed protein product [Nippostrongylus brasiliensis]|uniref:PBPe domain-containing protein n=1 Tax=Nippostrongylus brasiliensis TaxID=27835 RepID=A0A0N4XXP5_NIPBR|nr:unnamed protein product [Nippostrongylus brasiliensis]
MRKQQIESLRNSTLRVIVPSIAPPYVNFVNFSKDARDEDGHVPGVVIQILMEIGSRLQLTFEVIPNNISAESDSWGRAFKALQDKEADVLVGGSVMQHNGNSEVDWTFPFQYEETGMLIFSPKRGHKQAMLIVTDPFHWQVWILTAACAVVSAIVLHFMAKELANVNAERRFRALTSLWVFFSILVQQGITEKPQSWSIRVLLSFWWLASITLTATFTGSLVALFAVEKRELPFQDIEGLLRLVKEGQYSILIDSSSTEEANMIARSQLVVCEKLWYQMSVKKRVKYVDGMDKAVKFLVNSSGYVLLGPMTVLSYYAQRDCRLRLVPNGFLPSYLYIPFAKNSPYTSYFSERIQELVERGFIQRWIREYEDRFYQRHKCNMTGPAETFLEIGEAQGAFWVLIGGLTIGFTTLLVEMAIDYRLRRRTARDGSVAQNGWRFFSFFKDS